MNIKEHGQWEIYKPLELPIGMPPSALFCRRVTDKIDWYEYTVAHNTSINKPADAQKVFGDTTVKMTVIWHPELEMYLVSSAVTNPIVLFPGNQQILEILDYTGTDPAKDFNGKVYNPADGSFTDRVEPSPEVMRQRIERIRKLKQ